MSILEIKTFKKDEVCHLLLGTLDEETLAEKIK